MNAFIYIVVFGIVGYQFWIFFKQTLPSIKVFNEIFPDKPSSQMRMYKNEEGALLIGSTRKTKSHTWNTIIKALNKYLEKNKSRVADFNLVKDIVDRNCDAAEEDVREMIPVPLYVGLAGTMIGIIIGLYSLVISEGLETLLSTEIENLSNVGVGGLLEDVALAMIGSLTGVVFTIVSTLMIRKNKSHVEYQKHDFLSWIQAELLPVMNDSLSSTIERLSRELVSFNNDFRYNANAMSESVKEVNNSTALQVQMLQAVQELKTKRVSEMNLQLYERLSQSTKEIGRLAKLLDDSASYLEQVRLLNEKLDNSEQRMKSLEEMGEYFMRERTNVERMERISGEAVEHADKAIERMTNIMEKRLETMSTQFAESLKKQQQVLESKSAEMQKVITEVNNLSGVRQLLSDLNKTTQQQNRILVENAGRNTGLPATTSPLPTWLKVLIGVACSFIIIVAVIILIPYIKDLI